jgi:hypothetical protein
MAQGLGFSSDSKTVAVVSAGSNSVTLIESISVLRKLANPNISLTVCGSACASKRLSFRGSYSQLEKT